jgi:hypothetical protein
VAWSSAGCYTHVNRAAWSCGSAASYWLIRRFAMAKRPDIRAFLVATSLQFVGKLIKVHQSVIGSAFT